MHIIFQRFKVSFIAAGLLATLSALSRADETASYAFDIGVKLQGDVRNRGISDSLLRPGARLSAQLAHESGVIALLELSLIHI